MAEFKNLPKDVQEEIQDIRQEFKLAAKFQRPNPYHIRDMVKLVEKGAPLINAEMLPDIISHITTTFDSDTMWPYCRLAEESIKQDPSLATIALNEAKKYFPLLIQIKLLKDENPKPSYKDGDYKDPVHGLITWVYETILEKAPTLAFPLCEAVTPLINSPYAEKTLLFLEKCINVDANCAPIAVEMAKNALFHSLLSEGPEADMGEQKKAALSLMQTCATKNSSTRKDVGTTLQMLATHLDSPEKTDNLDPKTHATQIIKEAASSLTRACTSMPLPEQQSAVMILQALTKDIKPSRTNDSELINETIKTIAKAPLYDKLAKLAKNTTLFPTQTP